jgi:hypothetical protein
MSTPPPPGIRIGNDERESAFKALSTHLDAGRLDAEEYGERYAAASVARTRDELEVLFTDLPSPHAFTPMAPPKPPAPPVRARIGAYTGSLVALSPFIALALFFATGAHIWQFFLLVPVSAIIFGGGHRGRSHHRDQHRDQLSDRSRGPRDPGAW